FSDPLEHRFYFQDDTGAMRVQRRVDEAIPRPGTRVFVTGNLRDEFVPAIGIKSIDLTELKVPSAGIAKRHVAERRAIGSLFFDASLGEFVRVETEGIVIAAWPQGDRLRLELSEGGFRIPVTILDASELVPTALLDQRIAV